MANSQSASDKQREYITERLKEYPDSFRMQDLADMLCQGILKTDAPQISPIVVDGPWGSGKTIHAYRLYQAFTSDALSEKVTCIYWDASHCDFAQDPLPALVSHLYKFVDDAKKDEFVKSGSILCYSAMIAGGYNLAAQFLANKIGLDLEEARQAAEASSEEEKKKDYFRRQFREFCEHAKEDENRVDITRTLLESVRGDKELIIIIDELDRCRPDFALKLLETIKHTFSIPKCKFILVMNKTSMESAISHIYGLDSKSAKYYLRKFIKKEFCIPQSSYYGFELHENRYKYFSELFLEGSESILQKNPLVEDFINTVSRKDNLQLRDFERLHDSMVFLQNIRKESLDARKGSYHSLFILLVVYLLEFKKDICEGLLNSSIEAEKALSAIGYGMDDENKNAYNKECADYLRKVILLSLTKNADQYIKLCKEFECGGSFNSYEEKKNFLQRLLFLGLYLR